MSQIVNDIATMGALIRQERFRQSLTLEMLAGKTGVGIRFLSELERGKQTAQIGKVFSVLDALGVELVLQQKAEKPGFGNVFEGMGFEILKQGDSVVGD